MKKCIIIVSVIFMLISCSSDDESDSNTIPIEIKESELIKDLPVNGPVGGYYISNDINLFITSYYLTLGEISLISCDAFCPKDHKLENYVGNMYAWIQSSNLYFKCSECKAEFDYFSGKARNEEAKGHKLNVYKTEYDIKNKIYTVWR